MRVLMSIEDIESGCTIAAFMTSYIWKPCSVFKFLHVVELPVISECPDDDLTDKELLRELERGSYELLSKVRDKFLTALPDRVDVELAVAFGHPHHCILAVANEWNADLIVLGSYGKGYSLGSVSSSVTARATCPVTIVRTAGSEENEIVGLANLSGGAIQFGTNAPTVSLPE